VSTWQKVVRKREQAFINDHFFTLKPSQQVTVLLQELVHATPGINAAREPEYVLLAERLSGDFYKKVGP
jgi:hypothetical protein